MSQPDFQVIRSSPRAFRDVAIVDGRRWERDPWQEQFFAATDPACARAIGLQADGGYSRAWSIRHRGASKTTDCASESLWMLIASPKRIKGVVASGKRDQAQLLADAIQRFVDENPYLGQFVEILQNRVVNRHTGSTLDVISSDAPTSMGLLLDFAICDEVTQWRDRALFDAIFSAVAKKKTCALILLSNAGWQGHWSFPLWQSVQNDPVWFAHTFNGFASWIDPAAVAEQQRLLPESAFRRYWLNEWTEENEDGIPPSLIDAVTSPGSPPYSLPRELSFAVGGVDLALRRNSAAFAVCAVDRSARKVRTLHVKVWRPPAGGEIDIDSVEAHILETARRLQIVEVLLDPWGSGQLAQRLNKRGCYARQIPPSQGNLDVQARTIHEGFREGQFTLFSYEDGATLVTDLKRLSIVEKAGLGNTAFRLVSPTDSSGHHGDAASAWVMPATQALLWLRGMETRLAIEDLHREQNAESDKSLWGLPVDQVDCPFDIKTEFPRGGRR